MILKPVKKKDEWTVKEKSSLDINAKVLSRSLIKKKKEKKNKSQNSQSFNISTIDITGSGPGPTTPSRNTISAVVTELRPTSEKKKKTKKENNDSIEYSTPSKEQTGSLTKKKKKKKTKLQPKETTLSVSELQEKFDIKHKDIKKAIKGVIQFNSENPKVQNLLFQEQVPLSLQFSCHKVPKGHSKILRVPLAHSVLTPDDDICLIVSEVKGIKNIEHDKHVEHYEDLLRKKGVSGIKKIMTCHEFRTEHETFEQKARLADLYEAFLVDGRISGRVVNKCGKIFYKKRKVPVPVKLQVTNLKDHISKALSKVFCSLHLKGDCYNVQFGHSKMDTKELVENVYSVIDFLNKEFPGGFNNISGLQVHTPRSVTIPIYLSMKNPSDIKVPKVKSQKPEAYKTHKGELTTHLNSEVTVLPTGRVLVTRIKNVEEDQTNDDNITDQDIIQANKVKDDDTDDKNGGEEKKSNKKRKHKELHQETNEENGFGENKSKKKRKHKDATGEKVKKKKGKSQIEFPQENDLAVTAKKKAKKVKTKEGKIKK